MASTPVPSDCIEVNKPFLTANDAIELFSRLYGMPKAASVKQLDGYFGQNFLINIDHGNGDGNEDNTGKVLDIKSFYFYFIV